MMFSLFKASADATNERNGRLRGILIVGGAILGVILLLLGSGLLSKEERTDEESTVYRPSEDEVLLYQAHLEERIEELCRSVRGVDRVTAIVSLSGSFSSVYATEWKDGNEEYVILGSGSSATPLYLTRATPEIVGIGIVCEGGGDAAIRRELTELLCATFHLSSNRVYVTQAK